MFKKLMTLKMLLAADRSVLKTHQHPQLARLNTQSVLPFEGRTGNPMNYKGRTVCSDLVKETQVAAGLEFNAFVNHVAPFGEAC